MSRKKINICIVITLILCYLVSMLAAYNSAKEYVASDFQRNMENVTNHFESNYIYKDNTGENISADSIAYEFTAHADHIYPWKMALLDSQGKIAAKSGSWIKLQTTGHTMYVRNVDELLTEEHWNKLDEYGKTIGNINELNYGLASSVLGYALDCNIERNVLKPVKIHLVEIGNQGNTLTLELSKEPAEYHFVMNPGGISEETPGEFTDPFENSDIPYSSKAIINMYFEDGEENGKNRDIYKSLADKLTEENIRNNISGKLAHDYTVWDEGVYWYTNYLQIEGENYRIYLAADYDEKAEIIQSPAFENAMQTQTILFIITGIIILVSVNILVKKKQELEQAKYMFTSAVAHELKTPVTIIQNQCECILEDIAPEKNKDYVKSIYKEARSMNKLVGSFLQYSRLQTVSHIEKEKCSLTEIVKMEIAKYEDLMEAANLELVTEVEENVWISADKDLITLVIDNFLSNAYKYTDEEKRVEVKLQKEKGKCRFSVFNEGAHISEKNEKEIWDVLRRQDDARSDRIESSGMGLPICKKILELHGFEYGCKVSANGVTFEIGTEFF